MKGRSQRAMSFLPLKPRVLLMMAALARQGRMHGYALKEEVRRRSGGQIDLSPGTLYRTVATLLETQLIEETPDRPQPEEDDERRRYYILTELGREVLAAEMRRLEQVVLDLKAAGFESGAAK